MVERILIRADAGLRIGTGHVMRCLALAQTYKKRGGEVVFAMAESTPALEGKLRSEGFEAIYFEVSPGSSGDAEKTVSTAVANRASWIIVDGYHFDAAFQKQIHEAGQRLMVLDDYGHAERYCADFVLNQNLGAQADLYEKREGHTRLLLGPRYCLLRDEFLKWREWKRSIPACAEKLLITLGGSDPDNVTGKILQAMRSFGPVEVVVVVGGSNPHLDSLQAARVSAGNTIQVVVDTAKMPGLMATADLAITASGTTVWEVAFMGLPALTVVVAQNQQAISHQLQEKGLSRNLGWHADLSPQDIANVLSSLIGDALARAKMSHLGRTLVDGLGCFRVWLHLSEHSLELRTVRESDSHLIWEWANQPAVRAVSYTSDPIPWDNHVRWFHEKLNDTSCHFWVASDNEEQLVGQVRFETGGDEATISVSLSETRRGQGLGPLLIWTGSRRLFRETNINVIHAYVKLDNTASSRAFEKAGYERIAETIVNQHKALHLQLTRDKADL